jgi:ribosomal protein S2
MSFRRSINDDYEELVLFPDEKDADHNLKQEFQGLQREHSKLKQQLNGLKLRQDEYLNLQKELQAESNNQILRALEEINRLKVALEQVKIAKRYPSLLLIFVASVLYLAINTT